MTREGPLTADRLRDVFAFVDERHVGNPMLDTMRFREAAAHAVEDGLLEVYWLGDDRFEWVVTDRGREEAT